MFVSWRSSDSSVAVLSWVIVIHRKTIISIYFTGLTRVVRVYDSEDGLQGGAVAI